MNATGRISSIAELVKVPSEKRTKVFLALPNLGTMNSGLSRRILDYASNKDFALYIHYENGNRHHDFARNQCVKAFLANDAQWLFFIDSDVVPPEDALSMIGMGKKIIAGCVFCYVKNTLMPSIWINADCEQCVCVKAFCETGDVHNPTEYQLSEDGRLQRWNPFTQEFLTFADRKGLLENSRCRCRGTGKDPWVYRVHPKIIEKEPFQCDSLGAACLLIHRSVFEVMPFPWFRHLYKPSGEIMLTEDHYFCWKAKELGYEIWAQPQIVCSHFKDMDLLQVNNLMVRSYELGVEAGKQVTAEDPSAVVVPTPDDIRMVSE